ncbi:MAG: transglutaminase-like cysteine peptidase [Alphaproteobacteria bacterium]|nr:transglutaminase-like cysteine peptidase [Alphaproteobacteria bacterium]
MNPTIIPQTGFHPPKDAALQPEQEDGFFRAVARAFRRYKLGDLLVAHGVITPAQLGAALAEQKKTGGKLGKILVRQGAISAFQLYSKLAEQWCLRVSTAGMALLLQVVTPSTGHADDHVAASFTVSATVRSGDRAIRYPELFGTQEFKSNDIAAFKKWTAELHRFEKQMKTAAASSPGAVQWRALLRQMQGKPAREQIEGVNAFFNRIDYIEDIRNYGKTDYWATPVEFLTRGGDCEDFAIAKYAALRALGFSPQQLRVAIVMDEIRNIPHAILVVYSDAGDFVLDNQDKQVEAIAAVSRYKPIFSINSDSWWLHKA